MGMGAERASRKRLTLSHPPPFGMQSMEQMVVDLDKTTLRPVQRESYLCMARCCDSADSPVQLQQCVQRCEQSIQARHAVIQATMGDFQNRLQRCVGRCQDAAQESLPASSGDKDIRKAQVLVGGGEAIGWAAYAASAYPQRSPDAGMCIQVPCLHESPFAVPTRALIRIHAGNARVLRRQLCRRVRAPDPQTQENDRRQPEERPILNNFVTTQFDTLGPVPTWGK